MDRSRTGEAGGALVEFALSTLLFVPMALYLLYVGELFMGGIKAQEAEINGVWHVTGFLLHSYGSGGGGGGGGVGTGTGNAVSLAAEPAVRAELWDLDSFHSKGPIVMPPSAPPSTEGRRLVVTEQHLLFGELVNGQRYGCTDSPGPRSVITEAANVGYNAGGWVTCHAGVRVQNRFLGKTGHDEFYRGKPEQLPDSVADMVICGIGDGASGCRGVGNHPPGFIMLTDDWGTEDGRRNLPGTSTNKAFYGLGRRAYQGGGPGAGAVGSAMAELMGAGDQGATSTFKLGYQTKAEGAPGIDTATPISPTDQGPADAHLSPWDERAHEDTEFTAKISSLVYKDRVNDYLGIPTVAGRDYNQ